MWDELHDRMVYYYDFLNKENLNYKIPLFRETLHNEMVKWWLDCKKKGKIDGPIIHFDTHDDLGLPNPKQLLDKNGKLNEDKVRKGACGKIFWPITCMLLSKGIDHVIWAMPKWVYDDNAGFNQTLVVYKNNEMLFLRPKGQKKDNFYLNGDIEIDYSNELQNTKTFKFFHNHRLDRIKVTTKTEWKKLSKLINQDNFILDIDLDFFVCNGDKYSLSSYRKNFNDLESHNRVHGMPVIIEPRKAYADEISKTYQKNLNKELSIIQKRIKKFLEGLYSLQQLGITPCCISISDSTPSFFSGNNTRAVFTNHYTPKYFVPIIHDLLISGMKKIYGLKKFE